MVGDIHSFNPDFSIILCDFNARLNNWWVGDTQISEGSQIVSLTTSMTLDNEYQNKHIILKNSSSCTDLIFTN